MASSSSDSQIETFLQSENHSIDGIEAILNANKHLRALGCPPLVDIEFLKRLADLKQNPTKYDTSLPEAPEGFEYVVDIFSENKTVRLVPLSTMEESQ